MLKKNIFIIAAQVVVIAAFMLIAAGSGESAQQDYENGYRIGAAVRQAIDNWLIGGCAGKQAHPRSLIIPNVQYNEVPIESEYYSLTYLSGSRL